MIKVYYHSPCPDGAAAAAIFNTCLHVDQGRDLGIYTGMILDPYVHGETGEYEDGSVWLDCLPPAGVTPLLVLDHHPDARSHEFGRHLYAKHLSGAGMTWRYCMGMEPMPLWLQLLQEYDLSGGMGPGSREVVEFHAGFIHLTDCCPFKVAELFLESESLTTSATDRAMLLGKAILKDREGALEECVKLTYGNVKVVMGGRRVASLVDYEPGMLYLFPMSGDRVSARGPGAKKMAECFGGGGHEEAAGFRASLPDLLKILEEET